MRDYLLVSGPVNCFAVVFIVAYRLANRKRSCPLSTGTAQLLTLTVSSTF